MPPFLVEACARHYPRSPTYSPDAPETSKSVAARKGELKTFASVAATTADAPPATTDGTGNTAATLPFKIPKL